MDSHGVQEHFPVLVPPSPSRWYDVVLYLKLLQKCNALVQLLDQRANRLSATNQFTELKEV